MVRRYLADLPVAELRQHTDDRERLFEALESLPRTVCHFDVHPDNLFSVADHTVLVDWSFVGIGALGEDPGNLIPDALFDFHINPEDLCELRDAVLEGYLAGIADHGWHGDERLVRLAIAVTPAIKYRWIAPSLLLRAADDDCPLVNGRPFEEAVDWWIPGIRYLAEAGGEAQRLIGELN
jgi:thiamine kinase-like enzyme